MKLQSSLSAISWGVLRMHKEAAFINGRWKFCVIQQGMKLLSSIYSFIHSIVHPFTHPFNHVFPIEIPFDLVPNKQMDITVIFPILQW